MESSFNQYRTQNIPLFQSGAMKVSFISFLSPARQWGCLHFYTSLGACLLWWLLQAQFSSVQSLSNVQLFATPWTAAHQASLSITNSWSFLKIMSIKSVMPSNHLILCHPLSSCLQSFPPSGSFPMSQSFASGGQGIGVSGSTSVLPVNSQDWFPLGWTVLLLLLSRFSHVRLFATLWTAAYQAPRPWDFPSKSTGIGCHCLLRGWTIHDVKYSLKFSGKRICFLFKYLHILVFIQKKKRELHYITNNTKKSITNGLNI